MDTKLFYKIKKFDKNMDTVFETKKIAANSFVIQYLQFMRYFTGQLTATIKNTAGNPTTIHYGGYSGSNPNGPKMDVAAADNDSNYGIVVGSGTGTVTNQDYRLANQITHGLTTGLLDYGTQSSSTPIDHGTYISYQLARNFYNPTANPITLNEIGIYCRANQQYAATMYYYCLIHDLLVTPTIIGVDQTIAISYFIETQL